MQARQLCLDPVPVYGFFGRKLKNTVSITFCKQWIQIPRPCICVAFFYFRLAGVIIDTARCQIIPMGLNLFKLTASRSFIGGGNYG